MIKNFREAFSDPTSVLGPGINIEGCTSMKEMTESWGDPVDLGAVMRQFCITMDIRNGGRPLDEMKQQEFRIDSSNPESPLSIATS